MRNNLDRLGLDTKKPQQDDIAGATGLTFVTPIEIVDLPSRGVFYPEGHPLHNKDTIEIRYMTAKDEDTLSNQSLLKKGMALEKVLQDIVVDKTINMDTLLVGDKNAVIVAARKSAYGTDYQTKVTCPSCGKVQGYEFDLHNCNVKEPISDEELEQLGIHKTEDCTFIFNLPILKVPVELKLLTGRDENFISQRVREAQLAKKDVESLLLLQLRLMIKSINNMSDPKVIAEVVTMLPAKDSKTIRQVYSQITPNMDLSHDFECKSCSFETRLEVPFTADFFWPK
jgi:hypothetical protein